MIRVDPGSTSVVNSAAVPINFLSASPFLLETGTSQYLRGSVMGRCDCKVGSAGVSGSEGGQCDQDVGSAGVTTMSGARV